MMGPLETQVRALTNPADLEFKAMRQIVRVLDGLSDPARVRVLTWVTSHENEVVTQWDDKTPDEGQ
jgi:hypothetical protein